MTKLVLLAACALALIGAGVAGAPPFTLTQISADPFVNVTSQHKTEVEPDTFAFGSTMVMATQVGRFFNGGSSDIGFATSTDSGVSWTNGFLPGITVHSASPGTYDRVSDPSVAYDARHHVWLIASLPLTVSTSSPAILVNRSTNGGLGWSGPVVVATASGSSDFDKTWVVCDDTAASAFYGSCYVEYDDFGNGNQVHVAYSRDGGLTWQQGSMPSVGVIGGQPVVHPKGDVIMPINNANETSMLALRSSDGGQSWKKTSITSISFHGQAGNLRSDPLPSAEIDLGGRVYVVWADCRFRKGCKENDIVMSTSTNGKEWTDVVRIPIDATTSVVDHFLPGIAVDPTTKGGGAKLGLTYYYYPDAKCTSSTCQLDVGFISSANGGSTWSAPTQIAGPITLSWLPNTTQGRMVGDYISTSVVNGKAFGAFAVAKVPTAGGSDCASATPNCDQGTYTPAVGLSLKSGSASSAGEVSVPGARSEPTPSASRTAR